MVAESCAVVRSIRVILAALALILLISVPVGAAPGLQKGSQATYNLSASISFFQFCLESSSSGIQPRIVCPLIVTMPSSIDINGTIGWTATNLTSTTAYLNVTRDVTISSSDGTRVPVVHRFSSFNESIDLATRIVSIMPFFTQLMDEALQMAQANMGASLTAGVDLSSSMSMIKDSILQHALHTMWWVNGPLALNQTVPVLVFPTNVTGTSTVNLGSLGSRPAWTLTFKIPRLLQFSQFGTATTSVAPPSIAAVFTFNYDQKSDLLVSANADTNLGFLTETTIQPAQCETTTTWCNTTSTPITITHQFDFNIQASLTLANTNLNLDQRLSPIGSSSNGNTGVGSGSSSGTGTGSSSGTGTGAGSGQGSGSGTGTGSGSGSSTGSGTTSNSGSGTGSNNGPSGNGQSTTKPQPTFMILPASLMPWIYGIAGIVTATILGTVLWVARRRKSTPGLNPTTQIIL